MGPGPVKLMSRLTGPGKIEPQEFTGFPLPVGRAPDFVLSEFWASPALHRLARHVLQSSASGGCPGRRSRTNRWPSRARTQWQPR